MILQHLLLDTREYGIRDLSETASPKLFGDGVSKNIWRRRLQRYLETASPKKGSDSAYKITGDLFG